MTLLFTGLQKMGDLVGVVSLDFTHATHKLNRPTPSMEWISALVMKQVAGAAVNFQRQRSLELLRQGASVAAGNASLWASIMELRYRFWGIKCKEV